MIAVEGSVVLVIAGLFGLLAGSFVNVLVLRTHQATSPWLGRSKCVSCGHRLSWFDLVPLLSFTALRGRCRHCQSRLSWQYPIVEAATGVMFILTMQTFGVTWLTLWAWLICVLMMAIIVYDGRWSLLPDSFSVSLAIAGGSFAVLTHVAPLDLVWGVVIGAGFFGVQYIVSRGRWVGSGDILLGGALGVLLGWRMLLLALLIAYLVGAMVASVLLLTRRERMRSAIAFGPYLVIGAFIAWLWGQVIIDWYFNHALFM